MIQHDINTVFMNTDDFAEEHNINGTICLAVVEGLTTKERSVRISQNYDGIYGSTVIVHVDKSALTEVPVYGQDFYLDEELHYVEDCTDDLGMLTIELRSNRA